MPLEVRGDGEAHSEDSARDWLDDGFHYDGGNLVDTLFDFQPNVDVVQHVTLEHIGRTLFKAYKIVFKYHTHFPLITNRTKQHKS